jgi:hypothetical protein
MLLVPCPLRIITRYIFPSGFQGRANIIEESHKGSPFAISTFGPPVPSRRQDSLLKNVANPS